MALWVRWSHITTISTVTVSVTARHTLQFNEQSWSGVVVTSEVWGQGGEGEERRIKVFNWPWATIPWGLDEPKVSSLPDS